MREMIKRPDTSAGEAPPPRASAPMADASEFDLESKGLDLRRYFFMLAKRVWLLLLCFMSAVVIMLIMTLRQVPEYRAVAKIHLIRSVGIPASLQQQDMQTILGDYARTQVNILQSREVIGLAKQKLGLTGQEFNERYRGLSVSPVWQTAILNVSVTGLDPAFCADYANALADAFIEFKEQEQSGSSENTAVILSRQANRLSDEITSLEEDLLSFVRENSVVGIRERGNVAAQLLGQLSRQSAEYRTQRMLLEAQQPLLAQASDEVVLAILEYGLASPVIPSLDESVDAEGVVEGAENLIDHGVVVPSSWSKLKRDNAMLEARLVSSRKKYKDAHPLIQDTLHRLQQNEEAMKVEIQFALKQYYSELEALGIKEKAAQRVEQQWEEQALEIDQKQKEYDNIQRNIARLQRLYDLLINRLQEVDIASGIQAQSARILERAVVPGGPLKPRNLQSLFMAALIGLGVGVGLIFALEFMDTSVRFPEEIARSFGVPCLGLVPRAHWKQEDASSYWIMNVDLSSGFAEAYRNIRSSLLLSPSTKAFKTITVTSSVPKEGKSTTTLNLATSFAQSGHKVLIVDVDPHRGGMHRVFQLQAGRGFSDILMGQASMEEVTQPTSVEGLFFIGTGVFPSNPAELVLRREMREFLRQASEEYDLVILDAPPVLAVSETAVIASQTDITIMTIWSGRTARKLVQVGIRQLQSRGAHLAGCVLNNLDLTRLGTYGAYSYYH